MSKKKKIKKLKLKVAYLEGRVNYLYKKMEEHDTIISNNRLTAFDDPFTTERRHK